MGHPIRSGVKRSTFEIPPLRCSLSHRPSRSSDESVVWLRCQVTGSWKVWPIAHAINFRFIPSSQRVLYINTIQVWIRLCMQVGIHMCDALLIIARAYVADRLQLLPFAHFQP